MNFHLLWWITKKFCFAQYVYLEWLFVDVCVISNVSLPCLAKEDEFLKKENVTETFLLPKSYQKLILTNQLPLLL